VPSNRVTNLRAALGFLQLPPRAPELRLLHRWLDTWTGLGLIVVGVERRGLRFWLTHIADDGHPNWRWRIVGYYGEMVEESSASFPTIAEAVAEGRERLQRHTDRDAPIVRRPWARTPR